MRGIEGRGVAGFVSDESNRRDSKILRFDEIEGRVPSSAVMVNYCCKDGEIDITNDVLKAVPGAYKIFKEYTATWM